MKINKRIWLKSISILMAIYLSTGCHVNGKVFKDGAATEEIADPNDPADPSDPTQPNNPNTPPPASSVVDKLPSPVPAQTSVSSSGHKVTAVIGGYELNSITNGYKVESVTSE